LPKSDGYEILKQETSNERIAASARRNPQPIRTAKSARSRTPFNVFVSGALSHLCASSLLNQFPVRLPRKGTPLTARTPLAILEMKHISLGDSVKQESKRSVFYAVEGTPKALT
jgi:hypothetical protein